MSSMNTNERRIAMLLGGSVAYILALIATGNITYNNGILHIQPIISTVTILYTTTFFTGLVLVWISYCIVRQQQIY